MHQKIWRTMMSVEKKYVEFAIVLAANSNNPTILNPDFLRYNKIINDSWELKQPPICTEPFAQVSYKNGVSITSQLDKVIFVVSDIVKNGEQFDDICDIAKKYINLIVHVDYTGIGINPTYVIKFDDDVKSEEFILNNFLKIEKVDANLFSAGLNLGFSLKDDTVCNLDIKSGKKVVDREKKHDVIVVKANFHHELVRDISAKIKKMNEILELYRSDIDFFENNVISRYFKGIKG